MSESRPDQGSSFLSAFVNWNIAHPFQFFSAGMEAEVREGELEEASFPDLSPAPDSESDEGEIELEEAFFVQEAEELELEEGVEVVTPAEKERRLSLLGFEAAQILTGLKTRPQVDTEPDFDSDDDCLPIGFLGPDYFRERLPIQDQSRRGKAVARKKSQKKSAGKSSAADKSQTLDKNDKLSEPAAERPLVQQGMKGGRKKSKKLMTREELRVEEKERGWVPIGPEMSPLLSPLCLLVLLLGRSDRLI